MRLFDRTIVWVGRPSWLVSITGTPFSPRVGAVEEGPPFSDADTNAFSTWLSGKLAKGAAVDVVYAHHLLRVEAFTGVNAADLQGAMKLRLKKDLLVSVDGFHGLYVPLISKSRAQCVFAGTLTSVHTLIRHLLEAAGAEAGRVGFAGQLALRALTRRAPGGGWSVLKDVGAPGRALVSCSDDGQVALASYPAGGVDLAAAGAEIVRLGLPRGNVAAAPVDLATPSREVRPLDGPALPAPLSFTLPVFVREKAWRIPSQADERYPYVLAPQTWAFAAVGLAALLYTAELEREVRQIRASAPELSRLVADKAKLAKDQVVLDKRLAALNNVASHLGQLGAEPYDNGAWLTMISKMRDRHAPSLVFDRLNVEGASVSLSGTHDAVQQVLLLVKDLAKTLGEDTVRMGTFTRTADGRTQFSFEVVRRDARPPKPGGAAR